MADDQLSFVLSADDQASKAIQKVTDSLDKLAKTTEQSGSRVNRVFDTIAGVVGGNLITGAINKIGDAAAKAFQVFVVDGVNAAAKSEVAFNDLENALARAGNFSEKAAKQFKDFADEMETTTGVGDELINTAGSLIESLTRLDVDALQRATKAAINMSAALGKDLDASARLVSKAINGNDEALKSVGIRFDEVTKKALTTNEILNRLEANFGGAAAAKVQTFSGSLTLLETAFNNVQKAIGFIITENPVLIKLINEVSKVFFDLSKSVANSSNSLKKDFGSAIISVVKSTSFLLDVFEPVIQGIEVSFNAIIVAAELMVGGLAQAFSLAVNISSTAAANIVGVFDEEWANQIRGGTEIATKAIDDFAQGLLKKSIGDAFNLGDVVQTDGIVSKLDVLTADLQSSFEEIDKPIAKTKENLAKIPEVLPVVLTAFEEFGKTVAASLGGFDVPFTEALKNVETAQAESDQRLSDQFASTREEKLAAFQEFNDARLAIQIQQIDNQIAAEQAFAEKDIANKEQHATNIAVLEARRDDARKKSVLAFKKFEDTTQAERIAGIKSSFSTISTLTASNNSTLFAIGKAAAIANATIQGYQAVQLAFASAPPPFGFALAALVGAASAVNIANIASSQPPKLARGITEVPAGFGGDSFNANLTSGERVVPASSNQDLKSFLAESMGSKEILIQIANRLDRLESKTVVNIGGREIINEIRSSLQEGRSLQAI